MIKGFLEYVIEMSNEQPGYRSLIKNLLVHRLKLKYRSSEASLRTYVHGRDVPHWQTEIKTWEDTLFDLVSDVKPSLKSVPINVHDLYARLLKQKDGIRKTYPKVSFPPACPFEFKDIVGSRVWKLINQKQPKAKKRG